MARLETDVTRYELRLLVYDYASYFSAVVGGAADTIVEAEEDRDVHQAALRFKIHAIPAMQKAVFQSDPLAGLAEAWALSVQMRRFFEIGNGREVFGRSQSVAVDAARHLEEEVVVLVESVVGAETRAKSSPEVERWAEANPLSTLAFGRHTNSLDLATVTAARWGSGGLRSVGQIEELVRDLTDGRAVYAEQTPNLARWEAELLALETESRIVKPLWADILCRRTPCRGHSAWRHSAVLRMRPRAPGAPSLHSVLGSLPERLTRATENPRPHPVGRNCARSPSSDRLLIH